MQVAWTAIAQKGATRMPPTQTTLHIIYHRRQSEHPSLMMDVFREMLCFHKGRCGAERFVVQLHHDHIDSKTALTESALVPNPVSGAVFISPDELGTLPVQNGAVIVVPYGSTSGGWFLDFLTCEERFDREGIPLFLLAAFDEYVPWHRAMLEHYECRVYLGKTTKHTQNYMEKFLHGYEAGMEEEAEKLPLVFYNKEG